MLSVQHHGIEAWQSSLTSSEGACSCWICHDFRRKQVWACGWASPLWLLTDPPVSQQRTCVQLVLKMTHPHSWGPIGALLGDDWVSCLSVRCTSVGTCQRECCTLSPSSATLEQDLLGKSAPSPSFRVRKGQKLTLMAKWFSTLRIDCDRTWM